MDTIETFKVENLTVKIVQDESPESPREWSNLGTMVCFHRRYTLSDAGNRFADPTEFKASPEYREATARGVILPVYMYDHSGITIRTTPFSCPWDSGQVGWIYVSAQRILEEYSVKRITRKVREQVENALRAEVAAYDQFLRGDVYGYIIEDPDGNHLDSLWGCYGLDYVKAEANASALQALKSGFNPEAVREAREREERAEYLRLRAKFELHHTIVGERCEDCGLSVQDAQSILCSQSLRASVSQAR